MLMYIIYIYDISFADLFCDPFSAIIVHLLQVRMRSKFVWTKGEHQIDISNRLSSVLAEVPGFCCKDVRNQLCQGTMGCTPNSVPMVFIGVF